MSLTCYVVDDDMIAIREMSSLIDSHAQLVNCGYQTNALIALKKIMSGELVVDLLFLDIEMPKLNGRDFAKQVAELTHVVFVSAHDLPASQTFQDGVIGHLLKPVGPDDFNSAIERLVKLFDNSIQFSSPGDGRIAIKSGFGEHFTFVKPDDIIYMEASSNYVYFHITTGEQIKCRIAITELLPKLGNHFALTHRSFIVRLDKVSSQDGDTVKMVDGTTIPISRNQKKAFKEKLRRHIKSGY